MERLYPFVRRSGILLLGRQTLNHSKGKLHFVLMTTDISANSRAEILSNFVHYPVVQHYTSSDLEEHFGVKGAKVVGFTKSGLAQSIYAELKPYRVNQPVASTRQRESPPAPPNASKALPTRPSQKKAQK